MEYMEHMEYLAYYGTIRALARRSGITLTMETWRVTGEWGRGCTDFVVEVGQMLPLAAQ